jgi:uncharacterized membrane protein
VPEPVIAPTVTDPALRAGSEILGGPAGEHRSERFGFWTPLRVVLVVATAAFWLGLARTFPCVSNGWIDPDRYEAMCYSDVPILYTLRGLADGLVPYLDVPVADQPLEYPVLIGGLLWLTAAITRAVAGGPDATVFYLVNAVVMFAFYLVTVAATALTVRGRTWDGLLVAASPAVVLAAFINWDWPAVCFTALALLAWSRRRPGWAGVALGLAVAAKFYPLVLLGPLLLLCLRARRMRAFGVLLATAVLSWLAVNLPVMIAAFDGWAYFFTFSRERGQDFGSPWMFLDIVGRAVPAESLNLMVALLLGAACAGIALLILFADRRPRLAQVAFLVVAAFVLTNKVYSPQFVLWLLPLAVLARPRWRDIIWWQLAEAVYFAGVWWYLVGFDSQNKGLPEGWYAAAIMVHIVATLLLCAVVVRDILMPKHDPVRSDGDPAHADDPGGGVLDGANAAPPHRSGRSEAG